MKPILIARKLLRQNRWLLLLLSLWPLAMAAMLLLVPGDHLDADDTLSLLHEECLYGIALVAFNGSALLRNETRSRRIVSVLALPVSRAEYLFALLLAAWCPLGLYVAGFELSAMLLGVHGDAPIASLIIMASLQLIVGIWMAAASLFFSVWLPSFLASLATLASMGLMMLLPQAVAGPYALLRLMTQMTLESGLRLPMFDIALSMIEAAVLFGFACVVFKRRDLDLTAE